MFCCATQESLRPVNISSEHPELCFVKCWVTDEKTGVPCPHAARVLNEDTSKGVLANYEKHVNVHFSSMLPAIIERRSARKVQVNAIVEMF